MRLKWYRCTAFLFIAVLGLMSCSSKKSDNPAGETTVTPTMAADTTSTDTTTNNSMDPSDGTSTAAAKDAVQDTKSDTLNLNLTGEVEIPENGIAFSMPGYFYSENVSLEILSDKPGKIYYTTDGKDPGQDQTLYQGPFMLNAASTVKATCVKAKAYFDDGTESEILTHTYFVGKDAADRFDTIIFSVTTDPYNLYDYEYGIFVEGKLRDDYVAEHPGAQVNPDAPANFNMRGKDSEREVYLEVLEPNGSLVIGQNAGIRTYGGWSRARAQKSFKIFARKEYAGQNGKLEYDFFPDRTSLDGSIIDTFKQVVLRNCGNDNGFGFIRDELFETLAGQAGYQDYEAVRPAAVFVNGDYRGFFWLHEVYCDKYFEDHYGKYDGNFEVLEGGETYKNTDTDGENTDAVDEYNDMYYKFASQDLTQEANYKELCKVVDVENYLEYYALQTYIGNEDWPQNNYRTYRYYAADGEEYGEAPFDGKWRYMMHDLDFSFGIYGTPAATSFIEKYFDPDGEVKDECPLFSLLMQRADCREIFIKKTLDLLNGAFSSANLSNVLDGMNEERLNELKHTYNKNLIEDWVRTEDLPRRIKDIKTWATFRASYTLNSYRDYFGLGNLYELEVQPAEGCQVKINSYITDKNFKGNYYADYTTTVTAILPEGKDVDYWLVNGNKAEGKELVITASMIKDSKVKVSFVLK